MTVPEKFSKPEIFGPGLWFSIHTFAADAMTDEKKKAFIDYVYLIIALLKCGNCRKHAADYISKNSPEDAPIMLDKDGADVTMFKWSFDFHNEVNRRLRKYQLTWEEAYELFLSPNAVVCDEDCGEMTITSIHDRPLPFVAEKAKEALGITGTNYRKKHGNMYSSVDNVATSTQTAPMPSKPAPRSIYSVPVKPVPSSGKSSIGNPIPANPSLSKPFANKPYNKSTADKRASSGLLDQLNREKYHLPTSITQKQTTPVGKFRLIPKS